MLNGLIEQARATQRQVRFLLRRRSFYRAVFNTPAGVQVLADLKRFARAGESPITATAAGVDPVATAVRIGRQEMFQRILTHIHIDDRDLLNLKEDHE